MNLTCHCRCQLKYEYDLRGEKHRGEEKRKEVFVTSHCKRLRRIRVNKDVSKKAAERTRKGRVGIFLNGHAPGP